MNYDINLPQKIVICQTGPDMTDCYIKKEIIDLIDSSKTSIQIESPYFIPTKELENALINALRRNVEVILILPNLKDKKIVHGESMFKAHELLKNGAKVFLYKGFLHAKLFIIDSKTVIFGTLNADERSWNFNFELCVLSKSNELCSLLNNIIHDDIKNSFEKKRDWHPRQPLLGRLFYKLL